MQIKELIPNLDIDILASDFHRLDTWWNHKNVNNHFSRLYYITDGDAYVFHHGQKYHLKPNTVHLIPCFSFCNLNCPKEFGHYHISFTSRLKADIDLFNIISCDYQYEGNEDTLKMFKRLMELNKDSRIDILDPYQQLKGYDAKQKHIDIKQHYSIADIIESTGLMRLLLTPFLRKMQTLPQNEHSNIKRLNKMFLFIENNINKPITLEYLSKSVNLHPTYLSDFFVKQTGIRPIQYINQKKVDKAKMMIQFSNKTINEIANELGFSNIQYFSKTFKQYTGVSPSKFNKK